MEKTLVLAARLASIRNSARKLNREMQFWRMKRYRLLLCRFCSCVSLGVCETGSTTVGSSKPLPSSLALALRDVLSTRMWVFYTTGGYFWHT